MVKFVQAIELDRNKFALTNNGAVTLKSSQDPVLDLFSLVGASRGKNITSVFEAAYNSDPVLTTKVALWVRDCRGGAGERETFRQYLRWLELNDVELTTAIINSGKIQELGRWDDLLVFQTALRELAYMQIAQGLSDPHSVGLVAKWMPRQGPVAYKLAQWFHLSPRNWRKLLVRSTNVVEQLMCAKQWNEINFSHVPSVAASRYQKAFTKRAPEAYAAYKAALVKGDPKVKVNAATLYPYDVLKGDRYGDATVSQAQWDALPNYMGEHPRRILPLLDVSGSMTSHVPGSKTITHMDVCVSLGLYIALRQQGDFNRVVMNFSGQSDIVKLKAKALSKLYAEAVGMHWGMNTNLNAAFHNLLEFGQRNGVPNNEMPEMILVISDMEFDRCGTLTNMEAIERAYHKAGYNVPKIVFWCLNGRPGNVPVQSHVQNVALVSGFSPSIMKSVLSGKSFTPRDIMLETIDVPRYTID